MNIYDIDKEILRQVSSYTYNQGKNIFESGNVSKISGKNINNEYIIYGRVTNTNKTTTYAVQIKIDPKSNKVIDAKCQCDLSKEMKRSKSMYICKDIVAVYEAFSSRVKKRVNLQVNNTLQKYGEYTIYLKEILFNGKRSFKVDFFNDRGIKTNYNSIKDEKINDFLNKNTINGIIRENELMFLVELFKSKEINLNFDFKSYKSKVLYEDLPITFNIKYDNKDFLLSTKNKMPIPINSNMELWIYDRKIYVPSKEQINRYKKYYNTFIKKKDTVIEEESLADIFHISSDINISYEAIMVISNKIKVDYQFVKKKDKIICIPKFNRKKVPNEIIKYKENEISKVLYNFKIYSIYNEYVYSGSEEEFFHFVKYELKNLNEYGSIKIQRGLNDFRFFEVNSMNFQLEEFKDKLKLSINFHEIQELNSAFQEYRNNNKFYKMSNGLLVDMEEESAIGEYFQLLEQLGVEEISSEILINKNYLFYVEEKLQRASINYLSKIQSNNNINYKVPKELDGTLRDYQIEGFKWLKYLSAMKFGGILADEMGLGKTIQIISLILSEKMKKSLIIVPTSLIYNWSEEFKKFAPNIKIGVVEGNKKVRKNILENMENYDVLISSYGVVVNDIDLYNDIEFDFIIIDEGQNIKNPNSTRSKKVNLLNGKTKIALTGTPIENNLGELWSIFEFIMDGYLGEKRKFINLDIEEIQRLIKPFILRRDKSTVIKELPDKIHKDLFVNMIDKQKNIYNSLLKSIQIKIKEGNLKGGGIEVLTALTKLRQLALDPELLIEDYNGGSAKTKAAVEIIEQLVKKEHKILVFSQFTSYLNLLRERLRERNLEFYYIHGGISARERINIVEGFNSDSTPICLMSLKAAGAGLNMTAADIVIHLDPWWNPAIESQATDRAHRIGQRKVVNVIRIISKGTIEEKIILLQEKKRKLIDDILNDGVGKSGLINSLTEEEIIELFS